MKVDDASSDSVSEREELTKVQNINLFCFFVVFFGQMSHFLPDIKLFGKIFRHWSKILNMSTSTSHVTHSVQSNEDDKMFT